MQNPFPDSCWDCDGEEGLSGSFCRWRPRGSPTIVPCDLGWQHLFSKYENNAPNGMTKEDSTCPLHELSESPAIPGKDTEPHDQFRVSSRVVSSPPTKTEKAKSGDLVSDACIFPKTDGLGLNQTGVTKHSVDWTAWTWKQCENCCYSAEDTCQKSHEGSPLAHEADGISEPLHAYFGSNQGSDLSSEMHEDTAEIDALLYSDDDDDDGSEESEVESTGHSPCLLADGKKEQIHESVDVSSAETSRNQKRKLLEDADSAATLLMGTVSYTGIDQYETVSRKPMGDVRPVDSRKRIRRDAICEAVRILEKVVPGPKGKSTVAFLDDAIKYLVSLKAEACYLGISSCGS